MYIYIYTEYTNKHAHNTSSNDSGGRKKKQENKKMGIERISYR